MCVTSIVRPLFMVTYLFRSRMRNTLFQLPNTVSRETPQDQQRSTHKKQTQETLTLDTMAQEETKQDNELAFPLLGTMFEALLTTRVGEGLATTEVSQETIAMLQLLQGTLVTKENLDRMLVSIEKVFVALTKQFVNFGLKSKALFKSMIDYVTSEEGLASLPWKDIMDNFAHGEVPDAWRNYTEGCVDRNGRTKLHIVIQEQDDVSALSFLTSPFGAFACRHVMADGTTALVVATMNGSESICLKMLNLFGAEGCRADQVSQHGLTALIWACRNSMKGVALKLLEFGHEACRTDQVSKFGCTALIWACRNSMDNVALKLLEFGSEACRADCVNIFGHTARLLADERGLIRVSRKLRYLGV